MDGELKRILEAWERVIGDCGNRYTASDLMGISRRTWDRWTRADAPRALPPGLRLSTAETMREIASDLLREAGRLEAAESDPSTAPRPLPPTGDRPPGRPPRLVG